MKNKLRTIKCFTLIELLASISIMVLLIAFTVAQMSKLNDEDKDIITTRNLITNIAKACEIFKSDWGEYPPGISLLISNLKLELYAKSKGVTGIEFKPYMELPSGSAYKRLKWECQYESSDSGHASNAFFFNQICEGEVSNPPIPGGGQYICYAKCNTVADVWTESEPSLDRRYCTILDPWDRVIYYKVFNDGSRFLLYSSGPDEVSDPGFGTFASSTSYPASYNKYRSQNRDNIVYGEY